MNKYKTKTATILFFCLFFAGCNWITTPTVIPDNGGMDEYDSQFISLLDKLNTPLELLNFLSTCHYKEHNGAYTPYEFYIEKEGDCVDFSIFSCYVLHYHDYNVYSVPIFFLNESAGHLLTIFEYKDTDADWYRVLGWINMVLLMCRLCFPQFPRL